MGNGLVGYFGYGSLVNRETLRTAYVATVPARLAGWRRHWQARAGDGQAAPGADLALLTVHEHAESTILGMLVIDRAENLPSVDRREAHYARVAIDRDLLSFDTAPGAAEPAGLAHKLPEDIYLYVGRPRRREGRRPALLQSYLDAVLAGYLAEFGEEGVAHFLATTVGFDLPVVADRARPLYPRAIALDRETALRFDRLLAEAGAQFAPGRHLG